MVRKLFKSIDRSDYLKLSLLVALYAILSASAIGVVFLQMGIDSILSLFIRYSQLDKFSDVVFEIVLAAIVAFPSAILIRKLRVWLISLPIQAILNTIVVKLIYGDAMSTIIKIFAFSLCAQAIGVAIGLGIRYLVRKVKARKQPIPA